MAYFEFPHTRTYDSDLGWLIETYKKLTSEYGALSSWKAAHEKEYAALKTEVAALIQNMTRPVEEWDGTKAYLRYTLVDYAGDTYIALQDVPAGVLITNTDYWAPAQTVQTEINAIKNDLNALENDIEDTIETVDLMTSDIITIKSATDTIDGFPYGGFCGGCIFQGRELYAFRAAPAHRTDENEYGKIVFYERSNDNRFTRLSLELQYDPLTYGECRDPNLSVSRDGQRLYISVFTSFTAEGLTHHSIVFVFNANLVQIGYSVIQNTVFWGNTLETPAGYLLHCDYAGNTIALYKSDQIVTNNNAASITWTKLTPFTLTSGRTYAEPTIGYFNNRLVMMVRTGGTYASEIAFTFDLEGISGWTQTIGCEYNIHAPALIPYFEGNLLPMTGSIVNAEITGDASYRKPYFMLISFEDPRIAGASAISPVCGGVIAPNNDTPDFGGYTTIVMLSYDRFGIMYYGDTDADNIVAFTELHLYKSLVNMDYHKLTGVRPDVIYFTPRVAAAYNQSISNFVINALSYHAQSEIFFNSTTSAASLTDKPTGLQSNFAGRAVRVNIQYYIELWYFTGTSMTKAYKTGTFNTLESASWTIS